MQWIRPRSFDYNIVVIGAGSAGLVTASIAAAAGARVAIAESGRMGGDCLNTGCVPSKALIHCAKTLREASRAGHPGLKGQLIPDFASVMERVRCVIQRVGPHDSVERYRQLGVEVFDGRARLIDPWIVDVDGRRLSSRSIVIATGAEPAIPRIPGIENVAPLTSETIWSLSELPELFLFVGGGAIGCELAQAYARLGSRVIVVESARRLLPAEDHEVSEYVRRALVEDGVEIRTGVELKSFASEGDRHVARLADGSTITCDKILVATGRRPRTKGFGLEELGLLEGDRIVVDRQLRTRMRHILAAGDVLGELQFTHAAGQYAWFAAVNALFGGWKESSADLRVFPSVIYTDPEIARVGLTEREAHEKNIAHDVTRLDLAELDRAIVDDANVGFVKVLTAPGKDRILGATIVAARAGDMIAEFALAMQHGLGLRAILRTIHPYPGWAEANRAVAIEWQKKHTPHWAMALAARWLRWQRS